VPSEPDGRPPPRWVLTRPGSPPDPADHLYERTSPDGEGVWTMRFVRSYPGGVTE
jgi:hypothetical protein